MNEPLATGNLEGHRDKSNANQVDLGYVPFQENDIHEQVKPGEHIGNETGDRKACITLLPFEIINQTLAQLPFAERSTTTSLVCERFHRRQPLTHLRIYPHQFRTAAYRRGGRQQKPRNRRNRRILHHSPTTRPHTRSRRLARLHNPPPQSLPPSPKPHLETLLKDLKSLKELAFAPPQLAI